MNVINKVTLQHMRLNKKRTLVTILGVIVSVAMIVAVSITAYSFLDVLIRNEINEKGKWHVLYKNVTISNAENIENDKDTQSSMVTKDIGYAQLEGSQNKYKPFVYIKSYDSTAFKDMPIHLTEGRLPDQENEILISEHILSNALVNYKVGDTVTYRLGHRYLEENKVKNELHQNNSYQVDDSENPVETFEESGEVKKYTIVGIMERMDSESLSSPGYTVVTYLNTGALGKADMINVSVYLNNPDKKIYDNLETMAEKAGITVDDMVINDRILAYSGNSPDDQFNSTILVLELILVVIIMIGSISLIYNAFAISISERSKHLGMLASIGATKKQKRSSVFFESFLVGIISIPLGLLAGIAGMAITFFCINPIFTKVFQVSVGMQVVVKPETIMAAVFFSAITIFISAYIPARRASKITPIDAIRQTQDIKLSGKTVKTSRLTRKLFGFEGELALKNLKRYKRRYRATVISLIISLLLFITASAYGYYLKSAFSMTITDMSFDAAATNLNDEDTQYIAKIQSMSSVKESAVIHDLGNRFYLDKESSEKYLTEELKDYKEKMYEDPSEESVYFGKTSVVFYAYDDASLAAYAKKTGVDIKDLQNEGAPAGIIINKQSRRSGYNFADLKLFAGKVGDTLPLNFINEVYGEDGNIMSTMDSPVGELKVVGITEEIPMGMTYQFAGDAPLIVIVSENTLKPFLAKIQEWEEKEKQSLIYESYNVFVRSKAPQKLDKELEVTLGKDAMDRISIINVYEQKHEADQALLLISVFAYGFIALITAICVANIFNTISTSIGLRRREFAMLKSVGMTPKAFNKMIAFESIFYGIKALIYGLPLSFGVIYLVYTTISSSFSSGFTIPWINILIGVCSVFIVVGSSMLYSSSKVKKENVIDALKSENM